MLLKPSQNKFMILDFSSAPSPAYSKFFEKFSEISTLPVSDWKLNHCLAYLCAKYKEHYGIDYTFRFDNTSPSKSYEVFQMNRLAKMLSKNPQILKDYIDWVFKEKVVAKQKRITSLAFLTVPEVVNEYKFKYLLSPQRSQVDRSSRLPDAALAALQATAPDIETYGQLAFLHKYVQSGSASIEQKQAIEDLTKSGFDLASLEKIK